MNYTETIHLPAECAVLTPEEQVYTDGGDAVSTGIQTALAIGAAALSVGLFAAALDGFFGLCFAAHFGEKTSDYLQRKADEAANLAVSNLNNCLEKAGLTN